MANYLNSVIDPWMGAKESVNTLSNLYTAKQNDRRMDQQNRLIGVQESQEGRLRSEQTLKMMTVPFEYTKIKVAQIAKFAQTIKNLPTEQRIQKYSDLMTKVAPMPITVHPTLGPLGIFDTEKMLSPEEFAKLDDKQEMEYLDAVTMTAGDISKMNLADKNAKMKADLISQKHKNAIDEIRTRGEENRKTIKSGGNVIGQFSQEEIDFIASKYNMTGKMPSLGRGKESTAMRKEIEKRAAQLSIEAGGTAQDVVAGQADVKALAGSLNFQEKQYGAMGSFVRNLDAQVERVKILAENFRTFDTRLLNVPLRSLRGRLAGNPLQAKYDMYLTEIESEIGKLATGSTASVAELSATAQQKWDRIHDKNLSIKDMLSLLEETKEAGKIRMDSVKNQLEETRKRMRSLGVRQPTMLENAPMEPAQSPVTAPATQGPRTAEDYLKKLGIGR